MSVCCFTPLNIWPTLLIFVAELIVPFLFRINSSWSAKLSKPFLFKPFVFGGFGMLGEFGERIFIWAMPFEEQDFFNYLGISF